MKEVAEHLAEYALALQNNPDTSLYIRSACNRYYYYIFLELRSEFQELHGECINFKHGSKGANAINSSFRERVMKRLNESGNKNEAKILDSLLSELNKTFALLYDIRQAADYENLQTCISEGKITIVHPKRKRNSTISMQEIKETVEQIYQTIQQLAAYRQMVGL
jgi:hypothetical protein